ncbi:MAG: hypothetical protein ACOYBS_03385 [Flavobacterium sp.]
MKNILACFVLIFFSCSKEKIKTSDDLGPNTVLLLKVDYVSHNFEEGKELLFPNTGTFTISKQYIPPSDFGSIKFFYQELHQPIFAGTIIWIGLGTISYPTDFSPASDFSVVTTADYVTPAAGFENILNASNTPINYQPIWSAVQNLVKVREYLEANPTATVKIFLYAPSAGTGSPTDWDWILILKKNPNQW